MTLLWVMTGSALGAMTRLWLVNQVQRLLPSSFPWGTLVVNASGALAIGLLAGGMVDWLTPQHTSGWALLVVGMLGSYTTVSSFSLQTLALWQANQWGRAAINVLASLALCLIAAALGLTLATTLS
ncbi:fluoride efflux transporter CrcB [Alcanivorax sp. 1008]|uniref:fluoride efflux transporter CrcB n=1 Tax=Alcanivorax sp. 1008 TaxID=2816853 RepID=UPI001D3AB074|nr:fluoride efflux transporter CrcB [Alcanivorax sp. 1008]MCC1496035.1 fluoride efflux transporter CrcB [Alcanivorax sp. 1008]